MRFSFYSDSIIRIEYSPEGCFRDNCTCVISNRDLAGTELTEAQHESELILHTPKLSIRCNPKFGNFKIEWQSHTWSPGIDDTDNLGGTIKSLDGAGAGRLPEIGKGALSRQKYFVIDDSHSPGCEIDKDSLIPQNSDDYRDIYFAAYDNYTEGLQALAMLTGRIPMIPRYALGLWYSRYYPCSDNDYKRITRMFKKIGIPLDVMVLDVDWHKYGWEGYDWNTDLIPDPKGLIKWFHDREIRVSLNVHPGGIPADDSHAHIIREVLGLDQSHEPIRLNLADATTSGTYMELLHRPLMDIGVDFWWIDGDAAEMPGLDSQLRTNSVYYDFSQKYSSSRPMILSRYGGLGSQRYPVGFSGDTKSDWAVLRYEVNFTSTAGNALMPYWSHDIGGFSGNHLDPQLYIRWVQFGALSPFLRLHSDHGDRAPWEYGTEITSAFKRAYELRMSLVPYLYSLCYQASNESMPIMRPLYLTWPDDEECYNHDGQYTIGDALLACPVTWPAARGHAHVDIYLPEGIWWDFESGRRYDGSCSITYPCPIDKTPLLARAGAIIPCQSLGARASDPCPDPLILHMFAGADGEFTLYEDDGHTQANERGEYALTRLILHQEKESIRFIIEPVKGRFTELKESRRLDIRLHGVAKPEQVTINGIAAEFDYCPNRNEASLICNLRTADRVEILFENAQAAFNLEPTRELEISSALIQSSGDIPPRLVLSALYEPCTTYSNLEFNVELPDGWSYTPAIDSRPNFRSLNIDIPKCPHPGHYRIISKATLPVGNKIEHAECIMDWVYASVTNFRVIGTFDNHGNSGMDISYGPEIDFGFHPVHDGRCWEKLSDNAITGDIMPLRYIDLTAHFGQINDAVAYAITYIHSEYPREVRFDLGADDGLIAWLNGQEILREPQPGPAAPGQFKVPVRLKAGWNQVMLKIGQIFGEWGFYFEIRKNTGEPAESLQISNTI